MASSWKPWSQGRRARRAAGLPRKRCWSRRSRGSSAACTESIAEDELDRAIQAVRGPALELGGGARLEIQALDQRARRLTTAFVACPAILTLLAATKRGPSPDGERVRTRCGARRLTALRAVYRTRAREY